MHNNFFKGGADRGLIYWHNNTRETWLTSQEKETLFATYNTLFPRLHFWSNLITFLPVYFFINTLHLMEQRTLKNVNKYLNTNIYSYLETFGGQSSILYLNLVHFFNTSVN